VGFQNRSIEDIAKLVQTTLADPTIQLEYTPSNDNRSYHVNSDKIKRVLGFKAKFTIEDAIRSIADAYRAGKLTDPLNNPLYSNIKRMQELKVN
jgi:nucleoside-diphosphate-sugar epimerase